jgi:hypothetical protein
MMVERKMVIGLKVNAKHDMWAGSFGSGFIEKKA